MKAIITGIYGQDGQYLSEFLLSKNYEIHGIIRGDDVVKAIEAIQPDEIYNLAAQSDIGISFKQPIYTTQVNAEMPLKILETLRKFPKIKMFQASTSEIFKPQNPYAIAKLYAHLMVETYRNCHGIFACNGILFNHESSKRSNNFVTKKITSWCGRFFRKENPEPLEIGNLDVSKDWGHAKDYVEAMYMILQAKNPNDWVIATGETHTVREFIEKCFKWMNKSITWSGSGINEIGKIEDKIVVKVNAKYFRPSTPIDNNNIAIRELGWKPKISFEGLVDEMMSFEQK